MDEAKKRIQECIDSKSTKLDLSDLGLTVLPSLPESLQKLYCSYNQLTELPHSVLEVRNGVTYFLPLPDSLQSLHCSSNQLSVIPSLPLSLQVLFCSNNQLTRLPLSLRINKCKVWCNNKDELYYREAINVFKRTVHKNEIKERLS